MSGVGVKSATEKTAPAPVPKTDDQLLRQLLRRVAALEAIVPGALPDNLFRIADDADSTKQLGFQVSGISPGVLRTITVPDADMTFSAAFAAFLNAPTSANFAALLSDESGTAGAVVLQQAAAYVPTWSGGGTPPALGNGTISGFYVKIGRLVFFYVVLTMGSTSTYGTSFWTISLPFAMSSGAAIDAYNFNTHYRDSSAGKSYTGRSTANVAQNFVPISGAQPIGLITATAPFTWATGDVLWASGSYITN